MSSVPVSVYACASMEALAEEMAQSGENVTLGKITWARFPDNSPNVKIHDVESNVWNRHVIFLADFGDMDDFFSQISAAYVFIRNHAKSFSLIMPFFPMGTMERVDFEGTIATADTMAWIMDSLPITRDGPTRWFVWDIHALPERFYFRHGVLPVLETAIPLLVNKIRTHFKPEDKVAIAFPDEGAKKRFGLMFKDYPLIICAKVRVDDKRVVKITDGDPKGHHVVIVDDLVQTGGTLVECKDALYDAGALEVGAYVTHGVFPQGSFKRFFEAEGAKNPFKFFWLTDSCPRTTSQLAGQAPFEVLSLSSAMLQAAMKFIQ